jgi:hypothetical protein
MDRHEIPTHLNVEDKAFAGLTMRQLMTVAIGLAVAYGAASECVSLHAAEAPARPRYRARAGLG